MDAGDYIYHAGHRALELSPPSDSISPSTPIPTPSVLLASGNHSSALGFCVTSLLEPTSEQDHMVFAFL